MEEVTMLDKSDEDGGRPELGGWVAMVMKAMLLLLWVACDM